MKCVTTKIRRYDFGTNEYIMNTKTQNCGKQLEVYAEEKFMLIDPLKSERNRCCFEWNHPLGKAAIALAI